AEYVGTHFDPYTHREQTVKQAVDRFTLKKRVDESHAALMEQQMLRPGVETYLETAKHLGLKIGLASSSNRSWVEGFLRRFDLLSYFECIRTSDYVKHVKP
ncbi:HAD hydrolase-like protein, partial [Microbacteriaceae bacterium K1510]|nr:HAD hydrolase-like protein [Microbacteriaceae bacterium K1510]